MKLPKKTKVQSLLFCRHFWTIPQAKAWAKKHGYTSADVDVTEAFIHLRQYDPKLFQPGHIRNIVIDPKTNIKAIVGRPWIPLLGNPHPRKDNDAKVLLKTVHDDFALHRKKHKMYETLAKRVAKGTFRRPMIERLAKPLMNRAARVLIRKEHMRRIKPTDILTAQTTIDFVYGLQNEFWSLWRSGALDQYIPSKLYPKKHKKFDL